MEWGGGEGGGGTGYPKSQFKRIFYLSVYLTAKRESWEFKKTVTIPEKNAAS
jgi:hypothetical protein